MDAKVSARLAQLCTEDARGPDVIKLFSGKARISQLETQAGDTILDDEASREYH